MGFENVGMSWAPGELPGYLGGIERPAWCDSITLHHTGFPDLALRPNGLTVQHMENTRHGYVNDNGWSSGPHLFVDDTHCLGMCDFRQHGIHAVAFNRRSIGIEVLGNYNEESPHSGRGANCWDVAIEVSRHVLAWLGVEASTNSVFFHRDDPNTTKTCPGSLVEKEWVIDRIRSQGVMTSPRPRARPEGLGRGLAR